VFSGISENEFSKKVRIQGWYGEGCLLKVEIFSGLFAEFIWWSI